MVKQVIPYIEVTNQSQEQLIYVAQQYEAFGAEAIYIKNSSNGEIVSDCWIAHMKEIVRAVDIPVFITTVIHRMEDIKKAIYTGAQAVVLQKVGQDHCTIIKEAIQRFGKDKIILDVDELSISEEFGMSTCQVTNIIVSSLEEVERLSKREDYNGTYLLALDCKEYESVVDHLPQEVSSVLLRHTSDSLECEEIKNWINIGPQGCELQHWLTFDELKKDANGLVPVVVQDYKTNEVLMLAYMNEESYNATLQTGRMTYYSRSRNSLWIKGETSGHTQYVKELKIDCDQDTLLAKVKQVGVACHTGNRSCFYTDLYKKQSKEEASIHILETIYDVILERKHHPKQGSYTNYLFEQGIDKILKKCGEEATEIIIASKNPDTEELKYEISDFLYHCMVLMVERGIDWNDIVMELSHRH